MLLKVLVEPQQLAVVLNPDVLMRAVYQQVWIKVVSKKWVGPL